MSRKKWLILFAVCFVLCILPVALLAVRFLQPQVTDLDVPVYTMEQSPSVHDGYTRTTLSSGSTVYENDYAEYALLVTGGDQSQLIGQTAFGGKIYAIPGQDQRAYVVLWDFMSPAGVYRNSQQPGFDWRTARFREMRLYSTEPEFNKAGNYKGSTDQQLIQEAVTSLTEGTVTSPAQVAGKYSTYGLYLFSDQLSGMTYCAGVYVDGAGVVYLAENTLSQQWFQASKPFSNWVTSP